MGAINGVRVANYGDGVPVPIPGRVTFAPYAPGNATPDDLATRTAALLASARTALPRSSNPPPVDTVSNVVNDVWPDLSDDHEAQGARHILAETILSMIAADLPSEPAREHHRRAVSLLRRACAGVTAEVA